MYDTAQTNSAISYASPSVEQVDHGKPLSMEITDRTQWAVERSRGIRTSLSSVRDRIFGVNPEAPGASEVRRASDCFASAWRNSAEELDDNLIVIERLASEIAGRF